MNSRRLESFLPSPVQMAPPGTVLGHGQEDGHITVGVQFSRNSPAYVVGPVQSPTLHGGTIRNSDTARHHSLVAVDKLQFGQPLQVLWVAHPLAGAPGGHFAELPEERGQPQLLVVFQRGTQASRLWIE